MTDGTRSPSKWAQIVNRGALPHDKFLTGAFSFAVVGIAATVTYGLATHLLISYGGMASVPASIAGYLAGIVVSYFGQSRLTFRGGTEEHPLLKFLLISGLGICVSVALMYGLHNVYQLPIIVPILATCILVPALTFIAMNFFVFIAKGR